MAAHMDCSQMAAHMDCSLMAAHMDCSKNTVAMDYFEKAAPALRWRHMDYCFKMVAHGLFPDDSTHMDCSKKCRGFMDCSEMAAPWTTALRWRHMDYSQMTAHTWTALKNAVAIWTALRWWHHGLLL